LRQLGAGFCGQRLLGSSRIGSLRIKSFLTAKDTKVSQRAPRGLIFFPNFAVVLSELCGQRLLGSSRIGSLRIKSFLTAKDTKVSQRAPRRSGFLAELCGSWEQAFVVKGF
jgi:hypothetical protein